MTPKIERRGRIVLLATALFIGVACSSQETAPVSSADAVSQRESTQVESTQVEATPVEATPVEATPVESTPVESTPPVPIEQSPAAPTPPPSPTPALAEPPATIDRPQSISEPVPGKPSLPIVAAIPKTETPPRANPPAPGEPSRTAADASPAGGLDDFARAQTPEEQAAALEQDLDRSLREFDALMNKEKTTFEKRRQPAGEVAVPGARGGGGSSGAGSPGAPEPGDSGSQGAIHGDTDRAAADRNGAVDDATRASRTPKDIPDGREDDIVARQIREAAVSEADPELRAKLWQEYRNYKSGKSTKKD